MCRTTRTHQYRTARASRLATIVLAALPILAAGNLCSAQTVWTAGTSDWFTPANWTLGVPNAASGTTFDAIIANGGTAQLSVPGGSVRRLRVGLLRGPGSLLIDGGILVVTENLHLNEGRTGFGTVLTPNDVAKPLINNGHITGNSVAEPLTLTGHVKGVGTLDNVNITGTLAPGLSPTILIAGNVAFSPTSTLVMELGGATPRSGYDQIQSSGAAASAVKLP